MKILLICKRKYTNKDLIVDKFGRLFHFPLSWKSDGNVVEVLCLDYFGLKNESVEIDGIQFHSLSFPSMFFDFFIRLRKVVHGLQPDCIVCSGDSHIGFLGYKFAKKINALFVFDLYHNYADFGSNKIPGMKYMYYKALKNADLVVSDSHVLEKKVAPWSKASFVATQGVDANLFRSLDKVECRKKLRLEKETYYVGYTGGLDQRFDYNTLITAVSNLRQAGWNLKLLIAGPNLSGFDLTCDYISYLGNLHQEEIPCVINACDVMCIPYIKTALSSTCNPCKLAEYIYCSAPIVATEISDVKSYLPRSGHLVCSPGDVDKLCESIVEQIRAPIIEARDDERYLWGSIGKRYIQEIESLEKNEE
jgi:glycosyltransferase involved in cell wall biosynthesis